ncbi:MAG: methyltransferase domain-containing protein [Gemmatimonadales bacterium]|nr:methyltransferase domain-containing protein [Gemmatimonadales bacterium]
MTTKSHWERVYAAKSPWEVSWYQLHPTLSLRLIEMCELGPEAGIIDVGGGTSNLVDELLARGFADLALLDISERALDQNRARLGPKAQNVEWIAADVTAFEPPRRWHLWHDRAVFHFLTEAEDRAGYRRALNEAVLADGFVIVATFGLKGPKRCSGLDVVRYSAKSLAAELGPEYELVQAQDEAHKTPSGKTQAFTYCLFRRSPT